MQLAPSKKVSAVVLAVTLAVISSSQAFQSADAKSRKGKQCSTKSDVAGCTSCCGDLKILNSALKKTGLDRTLRGKGPYTLFAPSDAAFAKIPKADREALLNDKKKLPIVLKYHVVPKKYMASDLASRRSIVTVQGESLMLDNKDGTQIVDGALVTKADSDCRNGVVHVIDTVLIPERGK